MCDVVSCSRRVLAKSVLAAAVSAAGGIEARHTFAESTPANVEVGDVYTFLILGLDTRTVEEAENSDAVMLSRVNLNVNTVRTISIPRDLLVEIPGVGFDKVSRAYDYGTKAAGVDWNAGAALAKETIEDNFGVAIDAVVSTDLRGMPPVVDALGGVIVNNPYDVYDATFPTMDYGTMEIFYPAGEQLLTGEQALEFSRTRHQDGDDGRVMRQQLVLTGLLRAAQKPGVIAKLPELITAHREHVMSSIPVEVEVQLVAAVPRIDPDTGVFWYNLASQLWDDTTASGEWVYQGDWAILPAVVEGFLAGQKLSSFFDPL